MSFITSQHHQAFENFWVSNTGAVLVGVTAEQLTPQAIGFYDVSPSCKEVNVSLANPNIKKTKRMKIKMGRIQAHDDSLALRNDFRPFETLPFTGSDIVSFTGVKTEIPNRGNWRQKRIALGYDGLDAGKSLSAILDDKPVVFTFILQGDPIQKFFGQNQISYEYAVDKGLCLGACDCFDACGKVDCKTLLAGLKKSMQIPLPKVLSTGAIVKRPITDFITLDTITKCTSTAPVVAPTLIDYEKYTISICDDGASTLSQLSAFYPGKNVTLESRVDSVSTYAFWQLASEDAPEDFTMTKHVLPICGTCPTCPDAYTSVAGLKVVQVRVACGADIPTLDGSVSTTLMASTLSGGDVYLIKLPLTKTDAEIEEQFEGCLEGTIIGVEGASCVGEEISFEWKQCESCAKTTKDFMLILTDNDCPTGDHLADLQKAYPGLDVRYNRTDANAIVQGACITSYLGTVTSDCLAPDATCGVDDNTTYSFTPPAAYKGKFWEEKATIQLAPDCTIPVEATDCCVCGIIVEGKAFHPTTLKECSPGILEYNPGDYLGVKVHVTAYTYDPTGNPCDVSKEYITTLQEEKLPSALSGKLVQKYERATLSYQNIRYAGNVYLDELNGFELTAKPTLFYDQYRLVLRGKLNYSENRLMDGVDDIAYNFLFASGTGKSFESHINALILSSGNPDLSAVVL
jgi:hypothetical protein